MNPRLQPPQSLSDLTQVSTIADAEKVRQKLAQIAKEGIEKNMSVELPYYQQFRLNFDSQPSNAEKLQMIQQLWVEIAKDLYPKFKFYEDDTEITTKLFAQIAARYIPNIPTELDPKKGVYLWGNYRIGKTFLMRTFAHLSNFLQNSLNTKYAQLPLRNEDMFYVECCEEGAKFIESKQPSFRSALITSNMTFDEIGLETLTLSYMKNELEFMSYILNQRNKLFANSKNDLPLITNLISNLNDKEFEARYGKRIALRTFEMCEVLEFRGSRKV